MKYLLSRCGDAIGSDIHRDSIDFTREQTAIFVHSKETVCHRLPDSIQKEAGSRETRFFRDYKKVIPIYSTSIEDHPTRKKLEKTS